MEELFANLNDPNFFDKFMEQHWSDLLLLHWPVPQEVLRPTIPDDLELDLFEGQAWPAWLVFIFPDYGCVPFAGYHGEILMRLTSELM